MPSIKEVLPALLLPTMILTCLEGKRVARLMLLNLKAEYCLMYKLDPHWHNNVFVHRGFIFR